MSDYGWSQVVERPPDVALRGLVRRYTGYEESTRAPRPRSVAGMSNVFPALRARDARGLIDFLERAFGFERHFVVDGENGAVEHSQIRCNGPGMVMIGSERADDLMSNAGRSWLYVVIGDPDAHHDRAKAAGAQIV